jgi:gliding motility-associated-like protein
MKHLLHLLLLLCSLVSNAQNGNRTTASSKAVTTQLPNAWEEVEPYENGFARVLRNNHFSFINAHGKLIAPLQFTNARNFRLHAAAVEQGGRWGFIGENGQWLIPARYEIVYDFTSTKTIAFRNKTWYILQADGREFSLPGIVRAQGFNQGVAMVQSETQKGLLTESGDIRWTEAIPAPANRNIAPANATNATTADCPDNLDFENGNFNNWQCFTGRVDSVGNTNVITVNPSAPTNNRHTIVPRATPSNIDPFGLFPINPPDGSNFAVRLGNTNIGAQAERIRYTVHVPVNDSNFAIRYDYAVVFQDPGHTNWTQPRFVARLFDSATSQYVNCASFEYISTSSLPGFAVSPVDTSVIFKPWSTAFISLRGYAGRTMYLEFTTADCVRRGHWGYAYVDVEDVCGQTVTANYRCGNPSTLTVTGPPGFQAYNWWNQNYTAVLATGEHAIINPAPASGSTVWLELIPYSDFGCRDTFPVRVTGTTNIQMAVSEQQGICAPHTFTFYNQALPSASAHWDFGDGTSGNGDTIRHTYALPGTYIVNLQVQLAGGCTGTAQDTIRVIAPTGSFSYNGGDFCNRRTISFQTSSTNIDSIRWDFGDGTIVTAPAGPIQHTYQTPGVYVPSVTFISVHGCSIQAPGTDTIRIENINAAFTYTDHPACGSNTVQFTDSSTAFFGIAQEIWDLGDGTTANGHTISHVYTQTGDYLIQHIVVGASGCRDTIRQTIHIDVQATPAVSISGPNMVCANATEVYHATATGAVVTQWQWYSSTGDLGVADSIQVHLNQPGGQTVQVIGTTAAGCADTTFIIVTVKEVPSVNPVPSDTLCHGSTFNSVVFTGNLPGTQYQWTNDETAIGLAATGTASIPAFTVSNTTVSALEATIVVTPSYNGCTGNPETMHIVVLPQPNAIDPDDQVVCNRANTQPVVFSNLINAYNYSWTNDNPTIGLSATGIGNIPVFVAINNSNTPVVAHVQLSAELNGCRSTPQTFTITVNPTPVIDPISPVALCHGMNNSAIALNSNVTGTSISWTNTNTSIGIPASGTNQIPAFTAINQTNGDIIAHIHINASANGCAADPVDFQILVNPLPNVAQPANQQICSGGTTTPVVFDGAVAGTSYTWTNNLPAIGLQAQGSGDIPAFNPINAGYSAMTATINVLPATATCTGTPKQFDITVYPLANLVQPLNQFICNGEPTSVVHFVGTTMGTGFSWTNDNPAVGLAASGNGSLPSFVALNNTNTTISANITVTANANGCPGVSRTFTIFIDPTPGMAQPQNIAVCHGTLVTPDAFTGTVAGTTFSWINNNPSIGLAVNGNGNVPSFVAINHSDFPVTAIVSVTGFANSCSSVGQVFTITVYPSPVVDSIGHQQLCHGGNTQSVVFTGNMPNTQYTWTNDNPSVGLAASGTGNIPSFVAINHDTILQVATILVQGTSNGCVGSQNSFKITVEPYPHLRSSADGRLCRGSSVGLQSSNAAQYNWTPSTGLSCTNCPNPTANPVTTTTYVVTGTSSFGCVSADSVTITVVQPFRMQVGPGDTLCLGESAHLWATGANSYQWTPAASLDHSDVPNPVATPASTTRYRVVGYDGLGCFNDTAYVDVIVHPLPVVDAGPNLTTTVGMVIPIHTQTQNGPITEWNWTPATDLSCADCANPVLTVHHNNTYIVNVKNIHGCTASDTLTVSAFCEDSNIFIPNAFTPDGDGLNDILMVRGTGISVKSFRIFNRWGNLVFEKLNCPANDSKFGWDGKIRGVPASPDVFVYTAEVVCDNGVVATVKGNTTILK